MTLDDGALIRQFRVFKWDRNIPIFIFAVDSKKIVLLNEGLENRMVTFLEKLFLKLIIFLETKRIGHNSMSVTSDTHDQVKR